MSRFRHRLPMVSGIALSYLLVMLPLPLGAQVMTTHTIDFESLEHEDADIADHGDTYCEDGFTITGPSLSTFGTLHGSFTGSTALFSNLLPGLVQLSRAAGAAFQLISIDLAELNGDQDPGVTIEFTGTLAGGGSVVESFTLDGIAFGAETFVFSGFSDLTSVEWRQENQFPHQFDNIVVVPEPAIEIVEGIFEGQVMSVNSQLAGGPVAIGDPVSGRFSFDSAIAAADSDPSLDRGAYGPLSCLSYSIGGYSGGLGGVSQVLIWDDRFDTDAYRVLANNPTGADIAGHSPVSFIMDIRDSTKLVFSSDVLPLRELFLSDFTSGDLALRFKRGEEPTRFINAEITVLEVPEPYTALLRASALAVLAALAVGRRRRR